MKNVGIKIFIFIFFVLALTPLNADTSEYIEAQIKKYSDNVGFVKGGQRDVLKQQFPMCDEFLDVHWFEKRPGKLHRGWRKYTSYDYKYDVYQDKYTELDKPVTVYELVEIQKDGDAKYYGLYFIRRAFPETWKQVIQEMTISGNNRQYTFHYLSKKYDASNFHLSMGKQYLNICVAKPNGHTALFYEMKTANRVLDDQDIAENIKIIKRDITSLDFSNPMVINNIKNAVVFDINEDEIIDFLWHGAMWIYSFGNGYKKSLLRKEWKDDHYKYIYSYPPKDQCTLLDTGGVYMLDGKNLLYKSNDTICNLTQLTTKRNERGN